jgi:hypothetical protein
MVWLLLEFRRRCDLTSIVDLDGILPTYGAGQDHEAMGSTSSRNLWRRSLREVDISHLKLLFKKARP